MVIVPNHGGQANEKRGQIYFPQTAAESVSGNVARKTSVVVAIHPTTSSAVALITRGK